VLLSEQDISMRPYQPEEQTSLNSPQKNLKILMGTNSEELITGGWITKANPIMNTPSDVLKYLFRISRNVE
jgi:hypothetical protein